MESPDRSLVAALLKRLLTRGLLSESTYSAALDQVHSAGVFPQLLQDSVSLNKEANHCECSDSPK